MEGRRDESGEESQPSLKVGGCSRSTMCLTRAFDRARQEVALTWEGRVSVGFCTCLSPGLDCPAPM